MLRIAVLGVGRIGRMHAENIVAHPRATLAGIFDVYEPSAKEIAEKLDVMRFESTEAVFASPEVDAVLIATSTPTHADLLEKAVAARKPALCEKPIDLSLDRVNACATKIAGSGVPIMLGFVRRFDSGHRAVREAVENGTIGELHQVVITSRDPGMAPAAYIEMSGGIFRDMTIHDLDMARFLLGEEPVVVSAHASVLVKPELKGIGDFDSATVILETASGRQAVITNSRRATYGYDQRVEVHGSLGVARAENHHENTVVIGNADGYRSAPLQNFFMTRYTASYAGEIAEFIAALKQGRQPATTGEDGVVALKLANACVQSVETGKRVTV